LPGQCRRRDRANDPHGNQERTMDLMSLRPTTQTAAAIAEALTRAEAMRGTALQRTAAAKATRDEMLLDGDAKQLAAAEKALTEARGDGERVEAIASELTTRLTATRKAEAVGRVETALLETRATSAARLAWWVENRPTLHAVLSEGSALHDAAERARKNLAESQRDAVLAYDDAGDLIAAAFKPHGEAPEDNSDAWQFPTKVTQWAKGESLNEEVR
jgi:hypothetical protein